MQVSSNELVRHGKIVSPVTTLQAVREKKEVGVYRLFPGLNSALVVITPTGREFYVNDNKVAPLTEQIVGRDPQLWLTDLPVPDEVIP